MVSRYSKFKFLILTLLSILFLKLNTEILKIVSANNESVELIVKKIGSISGVYTQAASEWNPSLDSFLNILLLIFLLYFITRNINTKKKFLTSQTIVLTFALGVIIFSSNIITNQYRGLDLFLYCEINPIYVDSNPYLKNIGGLTAVYPPMFWDLIYRACGIEVIRELIYSYYIWIYTACGIYIMFLIRNKKANLINTLITLGIVLNFLGTNYHGIKTGNIGYLIGLLIAYNLIENSKSDRKFSSILLGLLLSVKPFYLFWFIVMYVFNKLFKLKKLPMKNINVSILTIALVSFSNLILYRQESVFFIENLFQFNNSINKPLNDKSGFLNLNFQEYIYRNVEIYGGVQLNKMLIIILTILFLFYFRNIFTFKKNLFILPIFITPRFKAYDLTFLLILFNKNNIYFEYILFCTIYSFLFIVISFTGAGYLLEISFVLLFIFYLKTTVHEKKWSN